jgi:hypothetical protein
MKSLSGEEVQKEEWAMIQAGFNDLEKRVKLLPELKKMGFEEEALLLCCCYIEAMGKREIHAYPPQTAMDWS